MKKILAKLILITSLLFVAFTPSLAFAQEDIIDVDSDTDTTTTIPTTGAPDTGIEPAENKVAQNIAVFAGGSLLGVGLGLGLIRLKKNSTEK